jgi:adenylate kinase family enzyme
VRTLITGASGSGTSTLARSVAARLQIASLDADDYFWLPTSPPYVSKREPRERLAMILRDLAAVTDVVLAGSIVDWGAELEDSFGLIVFLTLPAAIRVERLRVREVLQLGRADAAFLDWAAQYDEGRLEGRSRSKHERWLAARRCAVVRIDGEVAVAESTERVVESIHKSRAEARPAAR